LSTPGGSPRSSLFPLRRSRAALAGLAALILAACGDSSPPETAPSPATQAATAFADPSSERWNEMARAEELILRLTEELSRISFAAMNLELPDERTRDQFWPYDLEVVDLGPAPPDPDEALRARPWPVGEATREQTAADLQLWRSLLDEVEYFENAKFKIKTAHYIPGDPMHFEAKVAFSGTARMKRGDFSWLRGFLHLRWRLLSGADPEKPESWRIVSWQTDELSETSAPRKLFREVAELSLPDPELRAQAKGGTHDRMVAAQLEAQRAGEDWEPPNEYFVHQANDRHPGLAVVDIDADGFDDLYLMDRWGRNQLLRNRGDGSFEDLAPALGIDVDSHSSAAIFADFDNDGDPDLFLGRTLEPSAYFENEGDRFVDRSAEKVDGFLPYLVSSLNAVDYDGDGLLDVYVSTYAATMIWRFDLSGFLRPADAARLREMMRDPKSRESYMDHVGPPNLLLRNRGDGSFEVVEDPGVLASFRNTYQATWADFDADGDPDVYLANDFAPDQALRNDGEGRFSDVTEELGFTLFALGMGASFGDYDRDGRQDLYVSNMYSTAGSRITSQLDYLDPRFAESAKGNFLWRNEGDSFRKVSGDPGFDVEKTGWAWGSQFADVDNDGFLDLVVLNGFYTAPSEVAIALDT